MSRLAMARALAALLVIATAVGHAQWIRTNGPRTEVTYALASAVTADGDTLLFAGSYFGMVFRTSDYGDSWLRIDGIDSPEDTGFTRSKIMALAAAPNGTGGIRLFAATEMSGIFVSDEADSNWRSANTGLPDHRVYELVLTGGTLIAATYAGIFWSHDQAAHWSLAGMDEILGSRWCVPLLDAHGDTTLLKIDGNYLLRSTDRGINWVMSDSGRTSGLHLFCLASHDTIGYLSSSHGVHFTLDQGRSWVSANSVYGEAMAFAGPYLFIGTGEVGGTASVWRRPLSQMLTGIDDGPTLHPSDFELRPNYPNPFNATTTISFSVGRRTDYALTVADVLGRRVRTYVGVIDQPGSHRVLWDGRDECGGTLSSGIYFATLSCLGQRQTRRMLLLR